MKRSLRALLLLVGMVGTFAFAAMGPVRHGPIALCPPANPNCGD
jgi:hypothetical protein